MKNCSDFRERLKKDLFEGLAAEERRSLEDHLYACRSCQKEKEKLASTLTSLGGWEELPVPRSFYIYDDPASVTDRSPAMRKWMPLAASLLIFAIASVLFWANIQVTYGETFVAVGFGVTNLADPKLPADQVISAVQEALEQREKAWQERLQVRLGEMESEREERLTRRLEEAFSELEARFETVSEIEARLEAVSEMETRLSERMSHETRQLRVDLESSMASLYESLRWQYQRDLSQVIAETNRLAVAEMQQSRQASALASALITLADAQTAYSSQPVQ